MKKIAMVSLFAMSAFAASWTGYVSDANCGAKHADGSEKSMKCASACVKNKGAGAVLVVGDKVMKIDDASKAKVMDHLGHKVTVMGKADGDTITIDSVKMAH
ncbi:MAG TPA: hypothetical protein VM120_00130 [Bryobacteraceae bacterium]|nr:hypothetical protein [Bryobacteraceae bacterium]